MHGVPSNEENSSKSETFPLSKISLFPEERGLGGEGIGWGRWQGIEIKKYISNKMFA